MVFVQHFGQQFERPIDNFVHVSTVALTLEMSGKILRQQIMIQSCYTIIYKIVLGKCYLMRFKSLIVTKDSILFPVAYIGRQSQHNKIRI